MTRLNRARQQRNHPGLDVTLCGAGALYLTGILKEAHPAVHLTLRCIPGHENVEGNVT